MSDPSQRWYTCPECGHRAWVDDFEIAGIPDSERSVICPECLELVDADMVFECDLPQVQNELF